MTLSDQMVETAARARYARFRAKTAAAGTHLPDWDGLPLPQRANALDDEHAALTAALAVAKKEGAGVHVVPAKETHVGSFDIYKRGHEDGWNECRAATLAGRVWP